MSPIPALRLNGVTLQRFQFALHMLTHRSSLGRFQRWSPMKQRTLTSGGGTRVWIRRQMRKINHDDHPTGGKKGPGVRT
eukprot:9475780-Pyramimonas_sp.AAC.2